MQRAVMEPGAYVRIYVTDNTKYHTAINGGEEDRIHLVATVLGTK